MNKIAFISAVAFAAIPAMAQDAPAAANKADCCTKGKACCKADKDCCKATDKGVQCGDQCWLNVETITVEAENGDPLAQYTIAWLTETGNAGVDQDADKAADMYTKALPGLEKAAEAGNAGACLALARMYKEGKGVAKDDAVAKKYMGMFKAAKAKDKAAKAASDKVKEATDAVKDTAKDAANAVKDTAADAVK